MSQRNRLRLRCRGCDRPRAEGELFSLTGLCPACSSRIAVENHRQLIAHNGPRFEHWRRRTLAAFGIVLVDAEPDEVEAEQLG